MTLTVSASLRVQRGLLLIGLWLAVDKVIHHHDVLVHIVIRARRGIAGCDPHARDQRLIEDNTKKRKARIPGRSRHETAEQDLAVGAEVFNQRARSTISSFFARSTSVRLVNICENRAEATHRCRHRPVGARYKKQSFGDVAAHWSEQP